MKKLAIASTLILMFTACGSEAPEVVEAEGTEEAAAEAAAPEEVAAEEVAPEEGTEAAVEEEEKAAPVPVAAPTPVAVPTEGKTMKRGEAAAPADTRTMTRDDKPASAAPAAPAPTGGGSTMKRK